MRLTYIINLGFLLMTSVTSAVAVSHFKSISDTTCSSTAPGNANQAMTAATALPTHEYRFSEFQPTIDGSGSNEQPYIAISILLKRSPNVTEDWFHQHYKTVHADLTLRAKNIGIEILRYTQFHADAATKERAQPMLAAFAGTSFAPWDAISEFQAQDFEHFQQFMKDVMGDPAIVQDMSTFLDEQAGMSVMIGYENLVFGAAPANSNETSGIVSTDTRLTYSKDA